MGWGWARASNGGGIDLIVLLFGFVFRAVDGSTRLAAFRTHLCMVSSFSSKVTVFRFVGLLMHQKLVEAIGMCYFV